MTDIMVSENMLPEILQRNDMQVLGEPRSGLLMKMETSGEFQTLRFLIGKRITARSGGDPF